MMSVNSTARSMTLPLGLTQRRIYGGPYSKKPRHMIGVKLAPEVPGNANYIVPIRDFGVPTDLTNLNYTVAKVLHLLADNERPVYVGCYGGQGRTGLFLALVAKATGVGDPVAYVRENFNPKAVETEAQEEYVDMYESPLTWRDKLSLIWTSFWRGCTPKV